MLQGETFGSVSVIVHGGIGVLVVDPGWWTRGEDDDPLGETWDAAVRWAAEHGAEFADGYGDDPQLTSGTGTDFYYLVAYAG